MAKVKRLNLVDLPDLVLEKIFSFLTYDNIAQNRVVCTKFNLLGGKLLNKGYYMADRFHGKTLKAIKAKLPRRESERRVHPLARQCDILIAIETRLSMLSMTFTKWMEANLCCFIPGKVIDEIMRVLRCVANNPCPPRAHEILQELRDISSMAMEHFDEKILPILKASMGAATMGVSYIPATFKQIRCDSFLAYTKFLSVENQSIANGVRSDAVQSFNLKANKVLTDADNTPAATQQQIGASNTETLATVPIIKHRTFLTNQTQSSPVSQAEFHRLRVQASINKKKIKAQEELLAKQANEIAELRKHAEELEAKFQDLTTNLIKAKDLPSTSRALASTPRKRKRCSDRMLAKKVKRADDSTNSIDDDLAKFAAYDSANSTDD